MPHNSFNILHWGLLNINVGAPLHNPIVGGSRSAEYEMSEHVPAVCGIVEELAGPMFVIVGFPYKVVCFYYTSALHTVAYGRI